MVSEVRSRGTGHVGDFKLSRFNRLSVAVVFKIISRRKM